MDQTRKDIMRLIIVIAILALGISGCSFKVSEQNFIRPQPDAISVDTPLVVGDMEVAERRESIDAAEGAALHMVSLTRPGNSITVLYFGPNMFKISRDGARVAQRLLPLGVNLVMVDHRGSGGSSGTPTLALLEQDALAVFDHLRGQVPPSTILVHGLSLGSFMAAHVAHHRAVAGLVLEGSGTTVEDWARRSVPWYARPIVRLDIDPAIADKGTLAAIREQRAPLLILAGKRDREAPWQMSTTLFENSATPAESRALVVVEQAGHMDMLDWPAAIAGYRRILAQLRTE
ncbi:MAG: lysophospholipase [Xanthomonadales bacterium]|jgi:hypothetical protein|nr:lysophospholipase [Xanthomonadales bacterium]